MRHGPTLLGGCLAAVIALSASSMAFADPVPGQTGPGKSCCNGNPPPLSATQVSSLEGNINSILTQDTTAQIVATVRDLMLSDSNSLAKILSLLPAATADQQAAIASGLAQAAKLWLGTDPATSSTIQQQVAQTGDQPFILAYSNAAGNNPIGATGGGGGSAGGPGGQTNALGGTSGAGGTAEGIPGSGTNTGAFTMSGGVAGANNSNTGTTGTTTTSP